MRSRTLSSSDESAGRSAGVAKRAASRLARACIPISALLVSGCEGAMWGNLAVFAISVGIFMGTLSLGRS